MLGLSLLTYLLSLPLFEPHSLWPIAYVAFVPWALGIAVSRGGSRIYVISYLVGVAFFLTHFFWLYDTTPPGYVLGSLYLALFWPVVAWPIRKLYRGRHVPMSIALPVAWVAVEWIRSIGRLAFPWFLAGHTQIRLLTMIQIADLAGAFGVSFVVMTVNGLLVDLLLGPIVAWRKGWPMARRFSRLGTAMALLVVAGTIIYGRVRLGGSSWREGPQIAAVQGDYPMTTDPNAPVPEWHEKYETYMSMMKEAARSDPDMMVLPETPFSMSLNRELRELPGSGLLAQMSEKERAVYEGWAVTNERLHQLFKDLVNEWQCYLVVGSLSEVKQRSGEYPDWHKYNSAFVYSPGREEPERYDKIHLVLFGEYVPFRYSWRGFYRFLNDGPWNPWGRGGREYSLTPGSDYTTFTMTSKLMDNEPFDFGITICYEDVIPQVFRRFVVDPASGKKRVDFMLNISNDGWFGHGSQQPQHLVNGAFRAVENRVAVARAANTGITGFIRPDGSWYNLFSPSDDAPRAGGSGYRTARLPVDPSVSFYSRYGDLFAQACAALMLLVLIDAVVRHVTTKRTRQPAHRKKAES